MKDSQDKSPKLKRVKTDELDILSPHVLTSEAKLRKAYENATPYPHGRIEAMFDTEFLGNVLEEIKKNSKVKFKESDLFKVYQSIDLGNINDDDTKEFPYLTKLKGALYSPKYRAFVERISCLPPNTLTGQVDCAANCHAPGCHLLCHDDVIGTRKISYILYLTEEGWQKEEGGALEIYNHDEYEGQRIPQPIPCKAILPIFNSMAYFAVQPGISFHSVQEVYGERPRLSIQGWYHAQELPEGMENASLNRLKSTGKGEDTDGAFNNFEGIRGDIVEDEVLSEKDNKFLAKYINETYLSKESIKDIRERFEEDSSVQLRKFLKQEWMHKLDKSIEQADESLGISQTPFDYKNGISNGWKIMGPAHKQRFLEFTGTEKTEKTSANDSAGSFLLQIRENVFQSAPFSRFLKQITSLGIPRGHRGRIRRFRPGLDYTVAHYGILTREAVLDATLCFCSGNGEQCRVDEQTGELIGSDADAVWESGDCGGFECYIEADDDTEDGKTEAADEYNDEDDSELLSVSACNNTLSLVYRDPGTMRFVKYVGCRAPSSRWDISMEYEVEDDDEKGE
mmetsp:Transcript_7987/g.12224  ORF Transcript_7987/g.12224 Transcript_7987/m.12224 type:complete len:567 (-) Transcript_7987:279-1979(-)|eukprot:CAMPEP_0178931264 /NCGR_PEP_ID=MMETSP0786-20121207/21813_1 /TAXON_ID=186022 /ORGANISM="Thalassionema frauenfeldii, Strain CCMP 1798" /LENGTH=566 /DNA_ID=CAMNT_0020608121 /DNA_START=26 /DNA_END=1726 /DNA_ORIENTATION=-